MAAIAIRNPASPTRFITNAFFAVAFLVSFLARRPLVGVLVQYLYGLEAGWRTLPDGKLLAKRCAQASWVWVGVFSLRLLGQVPLFLGEHVAALGTVKLVLGLPLFALGGWLTWVLLRGVLPAVKAEGLAAEAEDSA